MFQLAFTEAYIGSEGNTGNDPEQRSDYSPDFVLHTKYTGNKKQTGDSKAAVVLLISGTRVNKGVISPHGRIERDWLNRNGTWVVSTLLTLGIFDRSIGSSRVSI
eukprot:m.784337 g.784337  ORF g.784337 m.784337 type:complete len:105 (+) comp23298_c1_seq1:46-360(+)